MRERLKHLRSAASLWVSVHQKIIRRIMLVILVSIIAWGSSKLPAIGFSDTLTVAIFTLAARTLVQIIGQGADKSAQDMTQDMKKLATIQSILPEASLWELESLRTTDPIHERPLDEMLKLSNKLANDSTMAFSDKQM